jgi:GNAT superfamily N-acetyltransferase
MTMNAEIIEESVGVLSEYGKIPISFEVRTVLDVQLPDGGLKGIRLAERPAAHPWIKDYDAFKGEGPTRWADHWKVENWGVISAFLEGARVGGCAIAHDTPGLRKLEDQKDIAVLWDIRVAPDCRGKGIGGRLVEASIEWAKRRRCRLLKVETQNVNVPACRLYAKHGFTLGVINRYAYPQLPDEVELIWYREP